MYGGGWLIKSILTILSAILGAGIIYFLKGVLINLRLIGNKLWLLVASICITLACGLQTFIVFALLQHEMKFQQAANYSLWSGLISAVLALAICSHYKFRTNVVTAPLI